MIDNIISNHIRIIKECFVEIRKTEKAWQEAPPGSIQRDIEKDLHEMYNDRIKRYTSEIGDAVVTRIIHWDEEKLSDFFRQLEET